MELVNFVVVSNEEELHQLKSQSRQGRWTTTEGETAEDSSTRLSFLRRSTNHTVPRPHNLWLVWLAASSAVLQVQVFRTTATHSGQVAR